MELSKQSYPAVTNMPVTRFQNYLKWKIKLDDEKKKMLDEEILRGLK